MAALALFGLHKRTDNSMNRSLEKGKIQAFCPIQAHRQAIKAVVGKAESNEEESYSRENRGKNPHLHKTGFEKYPALYADCIQEKQKLQGAADRRAGFEHGGS